jgi:nucleotide-binding universal stress UspA family protein
MKRFENILVIADSGTDHSVALQRAMSLAKSNQATLTLCAVIDAIPSEMQVAVTAVTPAELADIAFSEEQDQLDQIAEEIDDANVSIRTKVLVGKPFIEIIRLVLASGHDLIIKNAESDTGLRETVFGSTDMHLMRKCPCPVWITKPSDEPHYRRILAAVDQDPAEAVKDVLNQQILEISTSLALAEFSELHIVHAWQLIGENYLRSVRSGYSDAEVNAIVSKAAGNRRNWLENLVDAYAANTGEDAIDYLEPQLHVVEGSAKHIIPEMARDLDVDLIVMGTVARSGIAGYFMGNTAESILNQIDCSVLTIKPPGFESPVVT